MPEKKQIYILIILIVLLISINYSYLDRAVINLLSDSAYYKIERVIDGDTIVIENGTSVRLLGINSPEKGEKYYEEAKEFLENLVSGKKLKIEKHGKDKYYRELAYVFLGNENVNLKLVRSGLANVYILDNKIYEEELREAWKNCIEENKNLCEKSEDICSACIELKEFNYHNQEVVLKNECDFDCNLEGWTIKDEGRKKFYFDDFLLKEKSEVLIKVGEGADNRTNLYWRGKDYVWTDAGDTLFLRDSEGELVLWENY
jgi:endonuclease YncB( thermonuclease family)